MKNRENIYGELLSIIGSEDRVRSDVSMKEHTTFRAGGKADLMVEPATEEELAALIRYVNERELPFFVLGNGSDVLVRDGGYHGIIIYIGKNFSSFRVEDNRIRIQAGALLPEAAVAAAEHSLTGLEFASGIPGSVGGAVFMNAGAYGGEMSMVVESVDAVMPDGSSRTFYRDELEYGYRHSVFMHNDAVIMAATLLLAPGDREEIRALMEDLTRRRREKQPLEKASAGSTFKRPTGYFAGKLIDDAGCRGLSVGGAQVSPKHAGFIVNNGDATATEILDLIALVQMRVKETSGVDLHPEVRIIGD